MPEQTETTENNKHSIGKRTCDCAKEKKPHCQHSSDRSATTARYSITERTRSSRERKRTQLSRVVFDSNSDEKVPKTQTRRYYEKYSIENVLKVNEQSDCQHCEWRGTKRLNREQKTHGNRCDTSRHWYANAIKPNENLIMWLVECNIRLQTKRMQQKSQNKQTAA